MKAWRDKSSGGANAAGGVKIPSGGGAPMGAGLRQSMETKLGADLSDVNIHTGGDSATASKDLNARAFTTGTDVHFGAGEFNPGTKDGKKLLAHELTHVVQAKRSGISRSEDEGKEQDASEDAAAPTGEKDGEQLEVSDPDEPAEKEADEVADKVTANEPDGDAAEAAEAPAPVATKSISVAARLKGVGLKVFRSGPPPLPNSPGDPQKEKREQATKWKSDLAAVAGKLESPELAALLMNQELKSFMASNATINDVTQLKAEFSRLENEGESAAERDLQQVFGEMDAIDDKAPDAGTKLEAIKTHPLRLKWKNHPLWGERGKVPTVYSLGIETRLTEKKTKIDKEVKQAGAQQAQNPSAAAENPSESPEARELRIRKEYCLTILEQHFATMIALSKGFTGAGQIGGTLTKIVAMIKPEWGIPTEGIDPGNDLIQLFTKDREAKAAMSSLQAKGFISAIDSVEQIRSLMTYLDFLKLNADSLLGKLTTTEAGLIQKAIQLEKQSGDTYTPTPGAGGGKQGGGEKEEGGFNKTMKTAANSLDQAENGDPTNKPAVKAMMDANNAVSTTLDVVKSYAAGLEMKDAIAALLKASEDAKKAKEEFDKFLAEGGGAAPSPAPAT